MNATLLNMYFRPHWKINMNAQKILHHYGNCLMLRAYYGFLKSWSVHLNLGDQYMIAINWNKSKSDLRQDLKG